MARIRTIKPEFPQSESMGRVSRDARLLFIELWTICDDAGRTRAVSRMLASLLFPYDDDASRLIDGWLAELERERCIVRYVANDNSYVQICNWLSHQKIDKPSPSKIPVFDDSSRMIAKPRERSSEDQGREGIKDQGVELSSSLRSDSSSPAASDAQAAELKPTPTLTLAPPADMRVHKAERLRTITLDAIAAFNAALGKPNGVLPAVRASVGLDRRVTQVKRCHKVARDICQEEYGSSVITPTFWESYFAECARDPHKSGRLVPGKDHATWQPSFEYLTRADVVLLMFDKATGEAAA